MKHFDVILGDNGVSALDYVVKKLQLSAKAKAFCFGLYLLFRTLLVSDGLLFDDVHIHIFARGRVLEDINLSALLAGKEEIEMPEIEQKSGTYIDGEIISD